MAFKKGVSGNPSGKPKGATNKTSAEIKTAIQSFISKNVDGLQKTYDKLEPKDKAVFFERTLKYVIPTQTKADIEISDASLDNITFIIKGRDNDK